MAQHYQRITFNLTPNLKRYETLNGKQYLVLPAVMLTEGVHTGSSGPVLYEGPEIQKLSGPISNHRPAVVYHPTNNGSATDPATLDSQGVGMTMQSSYDGRGKTEVWADERKLRQIAPKVYDAIQNNKPVEVSTGLYHDLEEKEGEWQGQKYKGIVRNMVLDHLAILPDQVGACSLAKGAGLLRNTMHELSHNDVKDHLHQHFNGTADEYGSPSSVPYDQRAHIQDVFPKHVVYDKGGKLFKHQYKVKDGKATPQGEPEEVNKQTSYVTANGEWLIRNDQDSGPVTVIKKPKVSEMSEDMRKQQFQKTLSEKLAGAQQGGEWGGWVQQVLADHVVWSKDGKLFRLPYTYDNDKISLNGNDPEEVERVEGKVDEYRRKQPIDGTQSPYSINFSLEKPKMATLTNEQLQVAARKQFGYLTNIMKMTPDAAKTLIENAIHQGAGQLIHDATQHMDAHHPPGDGKSDSQVRSTAGGARKDAVDKLVGGGKWREEDRQFLTDLPDDHFERVQKNALAGATQPIIPYTYEGIGDRSNAHTANKAANQPTTLESWLANQPPEVQPIIRNSLAAYAQKKTQHVKIILNARGNRLTEQQLMAMPPEQLEAMASLVAGQQQTNNNGFDLEAAALGAYGQPNYGGQGEPIFNVGTQAPTNNDNQQDAYVLPLPSHKWADEKTA